MAAWPLGQGENSVIGEPGRRLEGDTNTRLSIYCARVTGVQFSTKEIPFASASTAPFCTICADL